MLILKFNSIISIVYYDNNKYKSYNKYVQIQNSSCIQFLQKKIIILSIHKIYKSQIFYDIKNSRIALIISLQQLIFIKTFFLQFQSLKKYSTILYSRSFFYTIYLLDVNITYFFTLTIFFIILDPFLNTFVLFKFKTLYKNFNFISSIPRSSFSVTYLFFFDQFRIISLKYTQSQKCRNRDF